MREHRWQDAAGLRHAISLQNYPLPPRPGEEIRTLCGEDLELTEQDFPQLPQYQRLKGTCFTCQAEWRVRESLRPVP